VLFSNIGAAYDTVAQSRGLGIALVDFTGCTSIEYRVNVRKVGTGTQDWQLWNETDGAEIGVVSDAAAIGFHTLTATINAGLPTGLKIIRVRARSTNANDDPVYLGSTIQVNY
jgi:hypothetical protein